MRGSMLAMGAFASILAAAPTPSNDFSSYRGFHFGAGVADSLKQAGAGSTQVRIVHKRPALLEDLDWHPESPYRADGRKISPVRDARLRFYNGKLFQIVVTYERNHIEGLTESDMVGVISRTYGTATRPTEEIPFHSNYSETAHVLARWNNGDYSCDLVRTGNGYSFALVLSSKPLNALAQAAILESARLDALEAPEREAESKRKAAETTRLALDKARSLNLVSFVP